MEVQVLKTFIRKTKCLPSQSQFSLVSFKLLFLHHHVHFLWLPISASLFQPGLMVTPDLQWGFLKVGCLDSVPLYPGAYRTCRSLGSTPMEESESLGGEDPRISDFSLRLITSSSLLESIFCTMVHVSTSSFKKCTISFFFLK